MTHIDTPPQSHPRTDSRNSEPSADRNSHDLLTRVAVVTGFIVVLLLLLSGASTPADARFPINNFTNVDDTATVTPSGANVAVSGWIKCTEGDVAEVRVTVSQDGTQAAGKTHVRCLGESSVQFWTIHVSPRGPAAFDADDPVRVDAWAVPRARGSQTDDPHTWTNDAVTLTAR